MKSKLFTIFLALIISALLFTVCPDRSFSKDDYGYQWIKEEQHRLKVEQQLEDIRKKLRDKELREQLNREQQSCLELYFSTNFKH